MPSQGKEGNEDGGPKRVFLRVIRSMGSWPRQKKIKPMTEAGRMIIGRLNGFIFEAQNMRGFWME